MAKKCLICGKMTIKKVENKRLEKILARLIVAENVKEFYMPPDGAFSAAVANAVKQMQNIISGVQLHAACDAPAQVDVVLCSCTMEEAACDPAVAALLQTPLPPRLICLDQ